MSVSCCVIVFVVFYCIVACWFCEGDILLCFGAYVSVFYVIVV